VYLDCRVPGFNDGPQPGHLLPLQHKGEAGTALEEGRRRPRTAMDVGKGRGSGPACDGRKEGRARGSSAAYDGRAAPRRLVERLRGCGYPP
jgi:hypothetical protein